MRWHGYTGTFLRETVDDQAEVLIGTRTLPAAQGRAAVRRAAVRGDAVTLGDLVGKKITMLEVVACRRCERRGRLSVTRLIEQHVRHAAARTAPYPAGRLSASCCRSDLRSKLAASITRNFAPSRRR